MRRIPIETVKMQEGPIRWRLWYLDYFDQDSERSLEAEGVGLQSGIELLWQRVLEEGILDDGRPTFTWFSLEPYDRPGVRDGRIDIPRDPLKNPDLGRIRAWRKHEGVIPILARAHLGRLDSGGALPVLENSKSARSPLDLIRSLEMEL